MKKYSAELSLEFPLLAGESHASQAGSSRQDQQEPQASRVAGFGHIGQRNLRIIDGLFLGLGGGQGYVRVLNGLFFGLFRTGAQRNVRVLNGLIGLFRIGTQRNVRILNAILKVTLDVAEAGLKFLILLALKF